ncbi:uncharacterized protein [Typha latifolia]|uniref:uncharacterized protein n=1 Tax=Typha latifolia TaxID=4733 RepID=UPI003C2F0F2F
MLRPSTLVSSANRLHLLSYPSSSSLPRHQRNPNFAPKSSIESLSLRYLPLPSRAFASHRVLSCRSAKRLEESEVVVADLVEVEEVEEERVKDEGDRISVGVGEPSFPVRVESWKMSLGDQAFFLLAFIAVTTSVAFTSLVVAVIPTLFAMKRAATSFAKLADTAREELPSTMAAIRLSGMEISDLTLELSDLSQEIADGVSKSAQAVQAAEAGIRQMGTMARQQTISMIQERASLPNISIQPVVAGAARRTSRVVGQAKKAFINLLSPREHNGEEEQKPDKVES